jgi:hypothetical protein
MLQIQRTALRTVLPAAVLGAMFWLAPSESQAAPRCSTKPAVCARIAAAEKQRAAKPVALAATPRATPVAQNDKSRCITKPAVCARQDAMAAQRPASAPVTLAQASVSGPRCATKPAVCARLRMRDNAPPVTLAGESDARQRVTPAVE